jgi:CheY-like chemotaxis protein
LPEAPRRVLVVEDERKIADFIRKGLSEDGYAVDVAYDGDEALDWAAVAEFDVIVLDVMLPVRDGMEVCRLLRQRGVRIPILVLTAGCVQPAACCCWPASGRLDFQASGRPAALLVKRWGSRCTRNL